MKEKVLYFRQHWWPADEYSLLFYTITFFYTLALFAIEIADTVCGDFKTPDLLIQVYFSLIPIYILVKEAERRLERRWKKRSGEKLVALWAFTFLVVIVLECATRGRVETPASLAYITVYVLGMFYGSRAIKKHYEQKKKKTAGRALKNKPPKFKNARITA